jgi:hypothetical protein
LTLAQSPEGDFVAIAFSRDFRPPASHAERVITFATAIIRRAVACRRGSPDESGATWPAGHEAY